VTEGQAGLPLRGRPKGLLVLADGTVFEGAAIGACATGSLPI